MQWDISLFHLLNGIAGKIKILDFLFIFLAKYLPYILVIAVFLIVITEPNWKKRFYDLFFVSLSLLLARGLVTPFIRFFYARPRPFISFPDIKVLIDKTSESAFPSGHAIFFFALALTIYYINKHWFYYFLGAALLMGIARVIVGVHYPLDIVGGAILGLGSAYVIRRLLPKPINIDTI